MGGVECGRRSAPEGVSAGTKQGARQLPPPDCETLEIGPTRGSLGGRWDLRSGGSEAVGGAAARSPVEVGISGRASEEDPP